MAVSQFRKAQAGIESSLGNAVAATARLHGLTVTMELGQNTIQEPADQNGTLAKVRRSYVSGRQWKGKLAGDFTFEDAIFVAALTMQGGVVPTALGGGSDQQTWVFEPTLDAANAPDTATMEFGDDTRAYQAAGVFGEKFSLSGAVDKAIQVSCDLDGKGREENDFTDPVSDRELEPVLTNLATLYVDAAADGTIGTTRASETMIDFKWDMGDHFVPKKRADGDMAYQSASEKALMPSFDVTAEFTTDVADVIVGAYDDRSKLLVRLKIQAEDEFESGKHKSVVIDGTYTVFTLSDLGDKDGSTTLKFTLHAVENDLDGSLYSMTVINTVSELLGAAA